MGLKKIHSTYMALTYRINEIYKARDGKENTIRIFLDLSKAFDTINHNILLQKLSHLVVKNNALL